MTTNKPVVSAFHDTRTGSLQYVVADPVTRRCAIIDPVLDFDDTSASTATTHADAILKHVTANGLSVEWILETHPHADHLSAARYLRDCTGAPIAIGERVKQVQSIWKKIYNWDDPICDGAQWDRLFHDGDMFRIGEIDARVIATPGHTLASITYVIGDAAFINDTLFMPDSGSARADFPGGSATDLWNSIERILALPHETRLFTGHDYCPDGRSARWQSTIAEQKAINAHLRCQTVDEYVAVRQARDLCLPMPKLMFYALQVNLRGGSLPTREANGLRYFKIPLNAFATAAR